MVGSVQGTSQHVNSTVQSTQLWYSCEFKHTQPCRQTHLNNVWVPHLLHQANLLLKRLPLMLLELPLRDFSCDQATPPLRPVHNAEGARPQYRIFVNLNVLRYNFPAGPWVQLPRGQQQQPGGI